MACQGDAPKEEATALTTTKLTGEWLCVAGSIDGNSEDVLFVEDSTKQQAGARLKFLAEEQLDFALFEQFGLNNPQAYKIEDKLWCLILHLFFCSRFSFIIIILAGC